MIFKIIEKKLVDADLVISGSTFFFNTMPSDVKVGVMTRVPLTGVPIDPYIEGRFKVDIQIITRHTDPVRGQELANAVSKALTVDAPQRYVFDEQAGSVHLFYPKTLPVQFPRLEGNGLEFSQHFDAVWTQAPAWR